MKSPRLSPRLLAAAALAASASSAGAARAGDTWSDPFVGVRRLHRVTANQNVNALVVDLCAPGVSLRATAEGEKGRKVSSFAGLVGAQAAINGDFFGGGYVPNGMAMSGGALWGSADHGYVGPLAFGEGRAELVAHEVVAGPEPWMREIVSGHPTILWQGAPRNNNGDSLCTDRHPRTAAGLSADRQKLFLAVVDGRKPPTRIGMTCDELSSLFLELGAHDAVNLDGGGSSAMWLGGGIVSLPSDGAGERTVGNHLAVMAKGSGQAVSCPIPMLDAKFVGQSSTAEPDPEGLAQFRVCAGESFHFSFELENTGRASWVDWGDQGTSFGHNVRLGVPDDSVDVFTGQGRISVNENVNHDVHPPTWSPPGGDCNDQLYCRRTVFTAGAGIAAKAPAEPGVYKTTWRLVDEGRAWFGPEMWLSFNVVECDASEASAGAGGAEGGTEAEGGAGSSPSGGPPAGGAGGEGGAGANAGDGALEGSCACRIGGRGGEQGALGLPLLGLLGLLGRRARRGRSAA